ncbi:hypothetical protein A3K78_03990 [Candidatus Bathyarchaeota archaeon RBG_13_52_12]|nr:MAG: hypothetical protein A3K78_03990 [Candidatus Bathyarchaeota archaeon RBG_13_52_12]
MSPRLVSALEWREHEGLYNSHLLLYDHGYTSLSLTPGAELNHIIQPGRRCIGYHHLASQTSPGEWRRLTPCPTSSLARGGPQCPSCQARDAAAPCLRCRGETCTAVGSVRDACRDSQAYVYLAAFGGKLKVGVTREGRYMTRWVEQGADAAIRVLAGNDSEARRLEHLIHTQLGVPESIRFGVKASTLGREDKVKQALILLEETRRRVHPLAFPNQRFNEDPWILAPHYNIPAIKQKPILLKVEDGVAVTGEVVGVKGPALLLRRGEAFFVLGLSALLGRSIESVPDGARSQVGLDHFIKR